MLIVMKENRSKRLTLLTNWVCMCNIKLKLLYEFLNAFSLSFALFGCFRLVSLYNRFLTGNGSSSLNVIQRSSHLKRADMSCNTLRSAPGDKGEDTTTETMSDIFIWGLSSQSDSVKQLLWLTPRYILFWPVSSFKLQCSL